MPPDAPVIEVRDLRKRFGSLRAVDGVSFGVRRGETYGLLGPNGAGKTSIMRMLAGLSPADGGHLEVAGLDVSRCGRAVRRVMGVVTQSDGLDGELSVRQNLEIFGYLSGLSRRRARRRADEVLAFFHLAERAGDEVDELSGGLRRRLAIARALVASPQVIVLDEPSTGLDPESRVQVWEELAALKRADVTVLMSTHYMDEAETLCDRVAILHSGRILDEGTPPELVARHAGGAVAEIRIDGEAPGPLPVAGPAGADFPADPPLDPREAVRKALAEARQPFREVGALFRVTGRRGSRPRLPPLEGVRITERAPNLEDVFLALAGRGLGEE